MESHGKWMKGEGRRRALGEVGGEGGRGQVGWGGSDDAGGKVVMGRACQGMWGDSGRAIPENDC